MSDVCQKKISLSLSLPPSLSPARALSLSPSLPLSRYLSSLLNELIKPDDHSDSVLETLCNSLRVSAKKSSSGLLLA